MKNKQVNSRIGGLSGALGGGLITFIFLLSRQTNNLVYLALIPILFAILLLGILLLVDKYVKVKMEE